MSKRSRKRCGFSPERTTVGRSEHPVAEAVARCDFLTGGCGGAARAGSILTGSLLLAFGPHLGERITWSVGIGRRREVDQQVCLKDRI